jgi:hypothetical protein
MEDRLNVIVGDRTNVYAELFEIADEWHYVVRLCGALVDGYELLQQKAWLDWHTPGWQLRENIVLLHPNRQVEAKGQRGKSRFCLVFERKEHAMLYRLTWQ